MSRSGTSIGMNTRRWRIRMPTCTTSITGTSTNSPGTAASLMSTRTATAGWCTRIRTIQTCITGMSTNRSVDFFDRQFARQARESDYALNPFERAILPHLFGDVLDLGCGLGNLAVAAAGAGCKVTALDASPAGVADLARRARERGLSIQARTADLRDYVPDRKYDCVVAIGLLMFFSCDTARAQLGRVREAVRPGGIAAVNVLIEGTTYMDMFDPDG